MSKDMWDWLRANLGCSEHVSQRVEGCFFWWQEQGICIVSEDGFAWQVQHFRRVVLRVFLRVALSGLRQVVTMTTCKFRGRRGFL